MVVWYNNNNFGKKEKRTDEKTVFLNVKTSNLHLKTFASSIPEIIAGNESLDLVREGGMLD